LAAIGYDVPLGAPPPTDVVTAFQRHWHPEHVTGTADAATIARAVAVAERFVSKSD
jgi:N-acetyl-anhydromuramyl-L-alanine amidase AmpD